MRNRSTTQNGAGDGRRAEHHPTRPIEALGRQEVGMNAVDTVHRATPRLEHATFGPASVSARSGCPNSGNSGIGHDARPEVCLTAHRSTRTNGRVDGGGRDLENTY